MIKCWPLGDPWACTTATCAVTCWPFWSFDDSATRIWESLESDDSKGTTSMTLRFPDGAVWRIIFFYFYRHRNVMQRLWTIFTFEEVTWLKFTWWRATGVNCVARWTSDKVLVVLDDVSEVFISESSVVTGVTVMKFLVVASRVAIIWTQLSYTNLSANSKKQRPNKTFSLISTTITSGSLKFLVTNDE